MTKKEFRDWMENSIECYDWFNGVCEVIEHIWYDGKKEFSGAIISSDDYDFFAEIENVTLSTRQTQGRVESKNQSISWIVVCDKTSITFASYRAIARVPFSFRTFTSIKRLAVKVGKCFQACCDEDYKQQLYDFKLQKSLNDEIGK